MPAVLACGAWLKNAACLLADGPPVWSAVHGDLSDPAACAALDASVRHLLAGCGAPVAAVAHDLHPDFFSTRLALALAAEWGVPAIGVQHHHAHMAAVLAEYDLDGPAVGLCWTAWAWAPTARLGVVNCCGWTVRTGNAWVISRPWLCQVATARHVNPGAWQPVCCMRWAVTPTSRHALPPWQATAWRRACTTCWPVA